MVLIIVLAEQAPPWLWALWCFCSSVVTLAQPAVAQAFPAALAGRAPSAFNLLIFAGVFLQQSGIGLAIKALQAGGLATAAAYQWAFAGFALASALSCLWLNAGLWRLTRRAQRFSAG